MLAEASRKGSSYSANSSTTQHDSSDSLAIKLMHDLKALLDHHFDDLCTGSNIQNDMSRLVTKIHPIHFNLSATSRTLFITIHEFWERLSAKLEKINSIIPSFEEEEQIRDQLLARFHSLEAYKQKELT